MNRIFLSALLHTGEIFMLEVTSLTYTNKNYTPNFTNQDYNLFGFGNRPI